MYIIKAKPKARQINFPAISAHAKQAGIKHYLVEQVDSADPFSTFEHSFAYLKKIKP